MTEASIVANGDRSATSEEGDDLGVIIGTSVGGGGFLAIAGILLFWYKRRQGRSGNSDDSQLQDNEGGLQARSKPKAAPEPNKVASQGPDEEPAMVLPNVGVDGRENVNSSLDHWRRYEDDSSESI